MTPADHFQDFRAIYAPLPRWTLADVARLAWRPFDKRLRGIRAAVKAYREVVG